MNNILLPGLGEQIKFLFDGLNIEGINILVIGSQSTQIAFELSKNAGKAVDLILEDYDSFMMSNINVGNSSKVNVKLMEFERTDFAEKQFDLIYSQASITNKRRKKIIKEIKRILKPGGYLCVGEIIKLKENIPPFIQNVFNSSSLDPLFLDNFEKYYTDKNFTLIDSKDLSETLKGFYNKYDELLKKNINKLADNEKSFYKKLLNQIKHERNVFLKFEGQKYIGFKTLLLKKNPIDIL